MDNQQLKVIFAENKYGAYFIPDGTEHRPACASILRGDVWEAETVEFICQHHGNGDIIHAGAFFGDFLPALSSALAEGSCVHAFEPNYENYLCAQLTLKINHLHNVYLHNCGLGAESATLPMKYYDKKLKMKEGGASRIYHKIPWREKAISFKEVNVLRGADVIGERYVSIIHLDIEGFEQKALAGLLPVITQHKPMLILETVPKDKFMEEYIFPLGYQFKHKINWNKVFAVG